MMLGMVCVLNAQDQTINGATFKADGKVGIGNTNPGSQLFVNGTATFSDDENIDISISKPLGKIYNYTRSEKAMTFNPDGSVGIGTNNTVGFKLGVNGRVAALEVKVAEYTNWPDYVFEEEYNLPTLDEVELHIKEKRHLTGIPSADKVGEEGFFLGDMNAKERRFNKCPI